MPNMQDIEELLIQVKLSINLEDIIVSQEPN